MDGGGGGGAPIAALVAPGTASCAGAPGSAADEAGVSSDESVVVFRARKSAGAPGCAALLALGAARTPPERADLSPSSSRSARSASPLAPPHPSRRRLATVAEAEARSAPTSSSPSSDPDILSGSVLSDAESSSAPAAQRAHTRLPMLAPRGGWRAPSSPMWEGGAEAAVPLPRRSTLAAPAAWPSATMAAAAPAAAASPAARISLTQFFHGAATPPRGPTGPPAASPHVRAPLPQHPPAEPACAADALSARLPQIDLLSDFNPPRLRRLRASPPRRVPDGVFILPRSGKITYGLVLVPFSPIRLPTKRNLSPPG
jgi:hypothetical protein